MKEVTHTVDRKTQSSSEHFSIFQLIVFGFNFDSKKKSCYTAKHEIFTGCVKNTVEHSSAKSSTGMRSGLVGRNTNSTVIVVLKLLDVDVIANLFAI